MSLENSQEDFISNEEHKSRMERIKAFVSKGTIRNSSNVNKVNESEGKEPNKEIFKSGNKPKLEPIPDTSHLRKKVNK